MIERRNFLKSVAVASTAGLCATPTVLANRNEKPEPPYKISLAEWSLHRTLRDDSKNLTNLDFPMLARKEFGIGAIEYVNQFFTDKAEDQKYLSDLKSRCVDHDVESLLIMVDREGNLGHADDAKRKQAVENHYRWVEAAKFLGCHSIRVNAASTGSYADQLGYASDGLRRLSEFAAPYGIGVIVENHGGLSSNGAWLAVVIERVGMENCGTLPDFGNFNITRGKNPVVFDRYQGVQALMPYAKAVSAKTHAFNENGDESKIDYRRMMQIVTDAGYHGYVGIEWEGSTPDEFEGIKRSKKLLEKVAKQLR